MAEEAASPGVSVDEVERVAVDKGRAGEVVREARLYPADFIQALQVGSRQRHLQRAEVLFELRGRPGAHNRDDHALVLLDADPGERHLGRGRAVAGRDLVHYVGDAVKICPHVAVNAAESDADLARFVGFLAHEVAPLVDGSPGLS